MSENLGTKIEQLRTAAGVTRDDLAEAAGLSADQMERIENSKASPSISTLIKISRRLGVRVGTLLDGAEPACPMVTNAAKLQPTVNLSKKEESAHLDFFSLAGSKSDRNMEPFYIKVGYIENEKKNYSSHEGEEFIFVLDGRLEIFYGGEKYDLSKGDSIYYDSIVPHLVTSLDKESKATIVAVTYTPY